MNAGTLSNALRGMSADQAAQMVGLGVKALQQRQRQKSLESYRNRSLNLQERKQEELGKYRNRSLNLQQQGLNLKKIRELRLRKEAKFDQGMRTAALNLKEQMQGLKERLMNKRMKQSEAEEKLTRQKMDNLKNKASTLANMNQKIKIPTTNEEIKLGAAIKLDIFGDLVKYADESSDIELDTGTIKNFRYLTEELGWSDEKAIKRVFPNPTVKSVLGLMGSINFNNPREAGEKLKEVEKLVQYYQRTGEIPTKEELNKIGTEAKVETGNEQRGNTQGDLITSGEVEKSLEEYRNIMGK